MKRGQKKRIKKPEFARWTKEQADAYSKDIRECAPIDGSYIHTIQARKQELKYTKEAPDEAIRNQVQSEGTVSED